MLYRDRRDAGRRLARSIEPLGLIDPVVLGLPRGGVPVAAEVAHALRAPLDVVVVRKLGVPGRPEYAMGAISDTGRVLDDETVRALGITPDQVAEVEQRERAELARRTEHYRGPSSAEPLSGRTAVVVDDGVATGATALAACRVVRAAGARTVVLAVPVAPADWHPCDEDAIDRFVCPEQPAGFMAIGQWYHDFRQTTDDEVIAALHR